MAEVATRSTIRSSFDLGWGGVSRSQLQNTIASAELDRTARLSMQLDQEISLQLSCPTPQQDTPFSKAEQQLLTAEQAELTQLQQALLLQQAQQQANLAGEGTPSADELGIDAQIHRLLQLKQYLRHTKQTGAQQQQHQQVILEDMALASDAADTLDVTASGLYSSSALCTPMPSESLSLLSATSDLRANSWSNLAAARAAAQPSRRSVDMGGLAQQLAALEMSNNAAAAAMAEAQALGDLASGMRNSRLSLDCNGLASLANEELVAAAAMAAAAQAQAEAVSRRTSLCVGGPQMSGLLDDMAVLNSLSQLQAQSQLQAAASRQSLDMASAAGASLAMQSSLYGPATPALDAQLQGAVTTAGLVGLNMPSPAALAVAAQRSPARHSLDCSLLGAAGMPPAALGGMPAGLQSPAGVHAPGVMPSPVSGRVSMALPQPPLLGDRGFAMAQAHAQAQQGDAAGWGFSARRATGRGRASVDVHRGSSDLPRSHTPEHHAPPRKSISMITPTSSAVGACSSSASSCSSGRSSPRGSSRQLAGPQQAPRRMSMDSRPPMHPPVRSSPSATSLAGKAPVPEGPEGTAASAASRKGTGVFIPACMLKAS